MTKVEKTAVPWYEDPGIEQFGLTAGGFATIFLYGRSGIGKTTSIRTLMDAIGRENVVIFPTEMRQYPLLQYKPFIRKCPDIETMVNNLAWLEDVIANGRGPKVAVVDDITSMSDKMKRLIYVEIPDKKKSFDRWEAYADRMLEIIQRMRDMEINWIILCQASASKAVDGNGMPVFVPEVHGNVLPDRLPGTVDEYFFMDAVYKEDTAKWERYFQTETLASGGTICKDSMGVLDRYEEPNWATIFEKLTGKPLVA